MLRRLEFPPYDPEARPVAPSASAWAILYMAMNLLPAGNTREETRRRNRAFRLVKSLGNLLNANVDDWRLKPEGGAILFEEAEFPCLKEALTGFRTQVRLAGGEALEWLDNLLEDAPSIDPNADGVIPIARKLEE